MSDMFGAIGDSINQDKGFVFGLVNNSISYAQSKKAQKRAFEYAKLLQQQQYDLTQKGYLESPGNKRTGLENAGYNPMLAIDGINSGSSIAGGTPVGANAVDSADLAGNALTLQRVANETKTTEATTENLGAQSIKARAEAVAQTLRNKFINKREKAEIANTEASTRNLDAQIDNMQKFQDFEQMRLQLQHLGILKGYEASIYGSNASSAASRYSAEKAYNATTQSAIINAKSKPFGFGAWYGSKMLDSVNSKGERIEKYLRKYYY